MCIEHFLSSMTCVNLIFIFVSGMGAAALDRKQAVLQPKKQLSEEERKLLEKTASRVHSMSGAHSMGGGVPRAGAGKPAQPGMSVTQMVQMKAQNQMATGERRPSGGGSPSKRRTIESEHDLSTRSG